ncbi:hypothetical protein H312_02825 [Anncaliia algerae PRA339]|uniref:Uncharacterized protein n=1 Tax=Anncaliia algerae PRA339 TaxID=1288291 RepID=A0A059EXK3_9MICR|nr:hypothetical protein H312_02825 [Anncaliia algerae PRA339]
MESQEPLHILFLIKSPIHSFQLEHHKLQAPLLFTLLTVVIMQDSLTMNLNVTLYVINTNL